MTAADYARAGRIARHACASQWPFLSREDREEVVQDAALAMWQSGSTTRAWWAAVDSAIKIQGARRVCQPIMESLDDPDLRWVTQAGPGFNWASQSTWGPDSRGIPLALRLAAPDDPEAEVVDRITANWLLDRLPYAHRQAVEATVLDGWNTLEMAAEWGVHDATVGRRRNAGLERLRGMVGA